MGRFIGPVCKKARRVGIDLNLKSIYGKSIKDKCKLTTPPGQHGGKKKKVSDYNLQLVAKQCVRFMYGVLEKQFKNYYLKSYQKKGSTGMNLLLFLESRLDNVVYRMGFASTRAEARQLVRHKFILVRKKNDKNFEGVVDIPSYCVKPSDVIIISKKGVKQERILTSLDNRKDLLLHKWVETNVKDMYGTFVRFPTRDELSNFINERLVVEFYTRQ